MAFTSATSAIILSTAAAILDEAGMEKTGLVEQLTDTGDCLPFFERQRGLGGGHGLYHTVILQYNS